ncbi:MAG TPA: hypothetical protein VF463_20250 [Sphingobium sp.]
MISIPTMRFLSAAAALLLLAGCATPKARLRTGLASAGLSNGMAGCMADDMMPHLTVKQLLRLRSLSRVTDRDARKTSIDAYLHQVRALGDGEIWSITSRAATRCALGL